MADPKRKRKKVDKDEEESVFMSAGSEGGPSGKAAGLNKNNILKKKVKKLSSSFTEVKNSVMGELAEIKWNIIHSWMIK